MNKSRMLGKCSHYRQCDCGAWEGRKDRCGLKKAKSAQRSREKCAWKREYKLL